MDDVISARVEKQEDGSLYASVIGPGAKAGGPNYVAQLGEWTDRDLPDLRSPPEPEVARLLWLN